MIHEGKQPFSAVMMKKNSTTRTASSTSHANVSGGQHLRLPSARPLLDEVCAQTVTRAGGQLADGRNDNSLFQQRYQLLSQVGKGGFGVIYKAADTRFGNRQVAIKKLSRKGVSPQKLAEATEAFKREAFLLARLVHPNLPRVYDFFYEDGYWYLVMDYIEGETLEAYLYRMGGRLPLQQVLRIGIQLCNVLGFLHTRPLPIIHRDLKPTNMLLTREGHVYLVDFGIARHFRPGQAKDTAAFGTPGYTAPEQYGQAQTTPTADIYSLGATLHRLLTGNDPTETPFRFAPLQLGHEPHVAELERLIGQMLDMDANRRPANMTVVKRQLQQIAAQHNRLSRVVVRTSISHSKRSSLETGWRALTMGAAVLIFLSGLAFGGMITSLLCILGSM